MEPRRARRPSTVLITDRDRELLAFIAQHRLVHVGHAAALLDVTEEQAGRVLGRLRRGAFIQRQAVFEQRPACYRIRRKGLDVIGSDLPTPGTDLRSYEHDVGLAWLWLAARGDTFGAVREILAERELRSHDESPERTGPPLAVRLGGVGRGGRERLHYPDMLLRRWDGRTVAVELELTAKGRRRLDGVLAGYGADRRIDGVLYLVRNRTIGNGVLAAARRLGVEDLVHVQLARDRPAAAARDAGRAVERGGPDWRAGRGRPAQAPGRGLEHGL